MGINWGSILAKAQAHMDTPRRRQEMKKKTDDIMLGLEAAPQGTHTVEEAGLKFANVLLHSIYASGLDPEVEARLESVDVGKPIKISDGKYMISVYFDTDLDRGTMSTKKDYYNINLARLYNNGVDHVMDRIFEWDGHGGLHVSRNVITGAHFAEQAVNDFLGNFGTEYNVIDIKDTF